MRNETTIVAEASASRYRAQLFSGVPLFSTRLIREGEFPFPERKQVTTPEELAVILQDYFRDRDREEFIVCLLDTANTLIGISVTSVGGLAASIVEARQVYKTAILANSAAIIVAHHHPSGNPVPSREDVQITRRLSEAGRILGIPLHDHLLILENGYVSLAAEGIL